MPYITSEKVKEIRTKIKKELPEFKFSITRQHHSSIRIVILSGPIDFGDEYIQVNHYCYENSFSEYPKAVEVFKKILSILEEKEPEREIVYDADYGSVPNYYKSIHVGKWDKKYKQIA